jgi:hypothetical protein
MQIVKVKYQKEDKTFDGRECTYFSEDILEVGDVVNVPVGAAGVIKTAMVTEVDLPDSSIEAFRVAVKTIPAGSIVKEQTLPVEPTPLAEITGAMPDFPDPLGDFVEPSKFELPANTALITINPRDNTAIVAIKNEIIKLSNYAQARMITCDADMIPANDDLSIISKLKKALKEKQAEYCEPIKAHLDAVKFVFADLLGCLELVDQTNRQKLTDYHNAQVKRQAEADELNRQAEELARKQAAFSGTGEFTVNTEPVEAAPVIHSAKSSMGTTSFKDNWTWELLDIKQVPDELKILDRAAVTRRVKSGERKIAGIRIYKEDVLQNRTR